LKGFQDFLNLNNLNKNDDSFVDYMEFLEENDRKQKPLDN